MCLVAPLIASSFEINIVDPPEVINEGMRHRSALAAAMAGMLTMSEH
jgi:hypothetical protein